MSTTINGELRINRDVGVYSLDRNLHLCGGGCVNNAPRTKARLTYPTMLSIRTVTHPLNLFMAYANSRLQPYQEVVWVIGDGRSGTNWLSQTINHDRRSRLIYEPFHPGKIASMKDIRMFQYIRPEADDPSFHETAGAVLRGACYNPRVTYANRPRFYRRLLIKDIFAHLFAKWASLRFPNTKIVLLMRHPSSRPFPDRFCEVVPGAFVAGPNQWHVARYGR